MAYDSFQLTPAEDATRNLGTTDAVVQRLFVEPVTQPPNQLTAVNLEGARSTPRDSSREVLVELLPAGTRHDGSVPTRPAEPATGQRGA